MKKVIILLAAVALAMGTIALQAGDHAEKVIEKKIVVAMSTDDFELDEIDISDLAVGDAETIVTESGKTIDLLRTEDGVEIYVDGEQIDIPHMGAHGADVDIDIVHEGHHDGAHKVIVIESDSEIEDMDGLHEAHENKVIVIRKHVEETL